MRTYRLTRLSDRALLRDLVALLEQDRGTTAALLAHLAEVDARRLYVPAGYPSMYAYCVQELHLSEDAAYKRIQAARTARQYPAMFSALAEGELHLSAVVLLAPHLTEENADELLGAATSKSKSEIELLLAQRFPRTELMPMVQALQASGPRRVPQLAPGQVGADMPAFVRDCPGELAPGPVGAPGKRPTAGPVVPPTPHSKVTPVAAERFALQFTVDQSTHDKLRYAQSLLSHRLPSGDIAQLFDQALEIFIGHLESRKFAATERPRTGPRRRATAKCTVPAHVKRAVWARDRGQCTFVGESGHRCHARALLEFDHADPVARGGQATVENLRIRCRSHNQYEAECAFGAGFMNDKREAARRERARTQAAESERDVMAALRTLGYRAEESRRAVAFSEGQAGGPLEDRVRLALSYFRPRIVSRSRAPVSLGRVP